MYIHLMEMSPHPERALQQGDRLATLVPDAGHLLHMATHIDVLCGDYALESADELIDTLPSEILRPMADWFEGFIPMKQHVLIRFGRWHDILSQPLHDDIELYSVTTAMMHYARTVALANTPQLTAAEHEVRLFSEALDRVPESRMLFNNTCRDILRIAEQMLHGELAYHQGYHSRAFDHLREAVSLDDTLPYDEPWGWMQPARHALGALLLEQGQFEVAEAVYRADLGFDSTLSRPCQHPGNVWSLHGLNECLLRRGETLEQQPIQLQLDQALARAQMHIEASCFCRQSATDL